jgi:cation transport ATPase
MCNSSLKAEQEAELEAEQKRLAKLISDGYVRATIKATTKAKNAKYRAELALLCKDPAATAEVRLLFCLSFQGYLSAALREPVAGMQYVMSVATSVLLCDARACVIQGRQQQLHVFLDWYDAVKHAFPLSTWWQRLSSGSARRGLRQGVQIQAHHASPRTTRTFCN